MLSSPFWVPALRERLKQILPFGLYGLALGALCIISPWLGLLTALAVLVVIVVLQRPVYLCYIMLLATVFASGMTRGKIIPYLIPNEAALAFVFALAWPIVLMAKEKPISSQNSLVTGIIILVVGTSVLPFLLYYARDYRLSIDEILNLVAPFQYVLVYLIFRYVPANVVEVRSILRLMLICAAIVGVIALLQAARVGFVLTLLSTWYQSGHEEQALQLGRVSSVLSAWNSLGTFLMLNLLVVRGLIVVNPGLLSRKMFFIIAAICAASLIASGSYASILGLIFGLVFFEFFDSRGRAGVLLFLASVPVLGFFLRENIMTRLAFQFRDGVIPQTLAYRFNVWQEVYWPVIQKSWLWGFRPLVPSTLIWQYTESEYITLVTRSGVFSLLAHFAWVGLILGWLYHNIPAADDLRHFLSISMFIALITLSIMGITNAVFTYSGVIEYVWILIALIGALEARQ